MGKKSAVTAIFVLGAILASAQTTGSAPLESPEGSAVGPAASVDAAPTGLPPVPILPVEAPESLLSLNLGDSDVELIAEGYWEVSVLASGAFGLGANAGASAPTLLFRQVPDLWLSLTILDRWFLEASLSAEGFGDEFAVGYRGGEGEFLQEVRLGNKGVSFPDLPYLSMGAGSSTSFGLSAYGRGEDGSAHFLLRYDQARRVTQTWVGSREVTRTEYKPSEYIRGRWFVLPDQNVSNLELYIESSAGTLTGDDVRKYRKMTQDEYSLSAAAGRVDLKTAVGESRRLLAYYSELNVLGIPYDSGPPFYDRTPEPVTVSGQVCLVLYEQGIHEGFLIANRYALASSVSAGSTSAFIKNAATGLPDPAYTATVTSEGYAQVAQSVADSTQPHDFEYRLPFLGPPDVGMEWLYDPIATTAAEVTPTEPAPAYSRILVLDSYGAPGKIVLEDTGVLPGSVEVRRNGVLDYGFRYDPASNLVTLDREPALSDTIEVSYLLTSPDRSAGSLAAGLGGIFDLSPDWRAWTALGLRWGIPGTGYSEQGDAVPGSLTLTAGFKGGSPEPKVGGQDLDGTPRYKAEAALAASYRREDASGYYRIAGMEESASWTSPFRPTSSWPAAAEKLPIEAVDDSLLESLFPDLVRRFHSAGSSQRALEFSFSGHDGSEVSAARYVEPVPVGDYRSFAFFARKDAATLGSPVLTVSLEGSGPPLSVQIPAAYLASEWRRFVIRYDGVPALYWQAMEGGAETPVLAAVIAADPSAIAGKVTVSLTGVTDGSVFLDELHFLDPVGEYSLSGRGAFAWSRGGSIAEIRGEPFLSDPSLSARLSGTLSEDSSFAGYLDGKLSLGPVKLAGNLRQGYSAGRFSDGAYGHSVELPLKGFGLADSFEYDSGSGRFGRRDAISIKTRGLNLSLDQSALYGGSTLEQAWGLGFSAGSALTLTGKLENAAPGAVELPAAYGEAWLAAFRYALPALENASSRRTTKIDGALRAGGGTLGLSFSSALLDAASPSPPGTSTADARLSWSFPAGKTTLEPYYRRAWSEGAVSTSQAFVDDWAFWLDGFARSDYLYRSVPFVELFDDFTSGLFNAAVTDTTSANYAPEAGIILGRRYGSRWSDLLVPSKAALSLKRELSSSQETVTDALTWEASASMAAINLFGSRGTYRATQLYSVDEYSQRFSAALTRYRHEAESLSSFAHTALASFYTSREDNLVAENRLDLKETRDGFAWSERLSLSLTMRPARTWLGDLVIRMQEKSGTEPGAGTSAENAGRGTWFRDSGTP